MPQIMKNIIESYVLEIQKFTEFISRKLLCMALMPGAILDRIQTAKSDLAEIHKSVRRSKSQRSLT